MLQVLLFAFPFWRLQAPLTPKSTFAVSSAAGRGIRGVALDFPALAGGTFLRVQRNLFPISPGVAASFATEGFPSHFYLSSFDMKPFSQNKALCYFSACSVKNISEGLSGNVHMFRCVLVIKSLKICQSESFELIEI